MQRSIEGTVPLKVNVSKLLKLERSSATEPEQGAELIIECARILEQLYPDKVILLCRKHHWIFTYAGGNSIDLWGYTKEQLESLSLENLIGLIHPDDMNNVKCGLSKLNEFAGDVPTETKSIFTYRIKTLSGEYITVNDEKVCVRTTGGTYVYFNIYSKSPDQKSPVKLELYKRVNNNRLIRVNELVFTDKTERFSPRELDVIKLIDKGLDNMAIANTLSLSVYTVKNHKQKMFRKANAKSSLELTRFARTLNLL